MLFVDSEGFNQEVADTLKSWTKLPAPANVIDRFEIENDEITFAWFGQQKTLLGFNKASVPVFILILSSKTLQGKSLVLNKPGATFQVKGIFCSNDYRKKGIASKAISAITRIGIVLVAGDIQNSNAKNTWLKLSMREDIEVLVVMKNGIFDLKTLDENKVWTNQRNEVIMVARKK